MLTSPLGGAFRLNQPVGIILSAVFAAFDSRPSYIHGTDYTHS